MTTSTDTSHPAVMLQTSVRTRVYSPYACFYKSLLFSDAARTYPVSGTYSPAQRDLYTAVLNAQKGLIKMCSEAAGVSLMDLHRKSTELLTMELKQISAGFHVTQRWWKGNSTRILSAITLELVCGLSLGAYRSMLTPW
jgi:Xaa-Pro aminopeptidase